MMLQKRMTVLVCGLVAMGLLSVGVASAGAADPEAECTGLAAGVNKFHIKSDPQTAGQPADLYGGGVLCGSDFGNGKESGYKSGTIYTPKGAIVRCANPKNPNACTSEADLQSGRYIGDVTMDIETILPGIGLPLKGVHTQMYVDQAPPNGTGKQHPNTHCTPTAVACYQGLDDLGTATADVIVKKTSNGKLTLVINQPVSFIDGVKVYYLKIGGSALGDKADMHLCRYAGAVNGHSCGQNAADWQQKNGPAGTYKCTYASLFFENVFAGTFPKAKGSTGYWASTDPAVKVNVPPSSDSAAVKAFLLSTAPNCAPVSWK